MFYFNWFEFSIKIEEIEIEDVCEPAHEQYIGTNPTDLDKFKNAAVAVDSIICSTVGK